jgi:hypothetical protein
MVRVSVANAAAQQSNTARKQRETEILLTVPLLMWFRKTMPRFWMPFRAGLFARERLISGS